jgi:hypothetical protein
MGIKVFQDGEDTYTVRITGLLKKSELDAVQAEAAKQLSAGKRVRMLLLLDEFKGWDGGEEWGDISFYAEHGDQITKIAIVGDQKHKDEFMMFVGAGLRSAPVEFFKYDQIAQARAWLNEQAT